MQKAKQEQLAGPTVDAFLRAVTKVAEGASGLIGESAIEPVVGLRTETIHEVKGRELSSKVTAELQDLPGDEIQETLIPFDLE